MSESISAIARYADVVSVRTVIDINEALAPVVRTIGDAWRKLARGRLFPSWDDIDTGAFGKALNNALVVRVVGDCEDYEFRLTGQAHIKALGLTKAPERLSQLDALIPGYGASLKPLYDRAVRTRHPYALRSELRRAQEMTPFFATESAFLPLGPNEATVDHVLVASLYRKLPDAAKADAVNDGAAREAADDNDAGAGPQVPLIDALRFATEAVARRMKTADEIEDPIDRVLALLEAGMPLDAERTATCRIFHRFQAEPQVGDALRADFALIYEAWRQAVGAAVAAAQAEDHFAAHDARALAESLVGLADGLGSQSLFDPKRMPAARLRKRLTDTVEHLAEGSPFGAPPKKGR